MTVTDLMGRGLLHLFDASAAAHPDPRDAGPCAFPSLIGLGGCKGIARPSNGVEQLDMLRANQFTGISKTESHWRRETLL